MYEIHERIRVQIYELVINNCVINNHVSFHVKSYATNMHFVVNFIFEHFCVKWIFTEKSKKRLLNGSNLLNKF